MSQYLPQKNFSWDSSFSDTDLDITIEKIHQLEDNDETGYFFEVDLEYPQVLHESHDCLLYTSPSPRDKRQSRMPSSA